MQNMTFDRGGSQGRLRACPFFRDRGARCFVVALYVPDRLGDGLQHFWRKFAGSSEARPAKKCCADKKKVLP